MLSYSNWIYADTQINDPSFTSIKQFPSFLKMLIFPVSKRQKAPETK